VTAVPQELRDTGITYRQLDHWVTQGYLFAGGRTGSGNPREWPLAEIEVARRMVRLVRAGLRPDVAAEVAADMANNGSRYVRVTDHVVIGVTP
jgi:DNA-binding transcriptional MerR regulator